MKIIDWAALDDQGRVLALARPALNRSDKQRRQVAEIIQRVRREGDAALLDYSRRFDPACPDALEVPAEQLQQAAQRIEPAVRQAMEQAIARIRTFHQAQMPEDIRVETAPGVVCEKISRPIQRVGLYVPAGTAPLPSTAIMLAVPAAIAGCPLKVLCTPPNAQGEADTHVLAAAWLCGIDRVFVTGGAQAVAAMAYGTETVPKVDKIFGPGNSWVTEAKQQVAMDSAGAAADMPAGPSEVLVVADGSSSPCFAAIDLLSQAEHGADSQAMLVCNSLDFAHAVAVEIQRQLERLPRADIIRQSLEHSRILLARNREAMLDITNAYASEHLILQLEDPRAFLRGVTAAGSVFIGPWTPEALGDYCSGTNHVLPTYGYARNHSGLSVDAFLTRITVQEATAEGLQAIGQDAERLAEVEGLDAHRLAVELRREAIELERQ